MIKSAIKKGMTVFLIVILILTIFTKPITYFEWNIMNWVVTVFWSLIIGNLLGLILNKAKKNINEIIKLIHENIEGE